jgi:hypothetical protein
MFKVEVCLQLYVFLAILLQQKLVVEKKKHSTSGGRRPLGCLKEYHASNVDWQEGFNDPLSSLL